MKKKIDIRIEGSLLRDAKELARRRGITFTALLTLLLVQEVERSVGSVDAEQI